jgi:hypothetical protein
MIATTKAFMQYLTTFMNVVCFLVLFYDAKKRRTKK